MTTDNNQKPDSIHFDFRAGRSMDLDIIQSRRLLHFEVCDSFDTVHAYLNDEQAADLMKFLTDHYKK